MGLATHSVLHLARRRGTAPVVLAACMLFGAGTAVADERAATIERLMTTGPLSCADAAGALVAQGLVAGAVDKMVDRLREPLGLNDRWVRGNSDWEKARALIAGEFAAMDKREGPALRPISGTAVARAAFEAMSADELALAAQFLPTHAGKMYWTYTVDFVTCSSFAAAAAKLPNAAAPDPALRARLNALDSNMQKDLPALSDADKAASLAASAKLDPRFLRLDGKFWNDVQQPLGVRAMAVMRVQSEALARLAIPYRKAK